MQDFLVCANAVHVGENVADPRATDKDALVIYIRPNIVSISALLLLRLFRIHSALLRTWHTDLTPEISA
jgi:hypothetical protein